jgi:hypothetical protein
MLLVLIAFTACSAPARQLVETGAEASCVRFEIQNTNGQVIEVPSEVQESLDCATGAISLSPDSSLLLFDSDFCLKLYDFANDKIETLHGLDDTIEGISCIWHKSGGKIACATIDQQNYDGSAKITVIELKKDGEVSTQEFMPEYEKMMDFVCGASCYPGEFWFEGDSVIKYKGHNIVAPGEVFEIDI